jgi:hypothetical protein
MSPPCLSLALFQWRALQHWTDVSVAMSPHICRSQRCCPTRYNTGQMLTSASVTFISSVCRLKEGRNDFWFKHFVHGFDSNLLNYKKYILANTLVQFGCVDHQTPKSKVNGPRVHFPYNLPLFGDWWQHDQNKQIIKKFQKFKDYLLARMQCKGKIIWCSKISYARNNECLSWPCHLSHLSPNDIMNLSLPLNP